MSLFEFSRDFLNTIFARLPPLASAARTPTTPHLLASRHITAWTLATQCGVLTINKSTIQPPPPRAFARVETPCTPKKSTQTMPLWWVENSHQCRDPCGSLAACLAVSFYPLPPEAICLPVRLSVPVLYTAFIHFIH